MAEVFWVSNGAGGGARTSRPHHVPMTAILEQLTPFEKRYLDEPPSMHPPAGHDHAQVVVHIGEEETNSNYPEAGYYHVVELSPDEARQLFGIGED